ncbi:MAG: LPS assembly protein LptD [Deltaproteobacteria bacterium]|nr:LPS assembly protein LptD [Deltaproteobacteria bacterium]
MSARYACSAAGGNALHRFRQMLLAVLPGVLAAALGAGAAEKGAEPPPFELAADSIEYERARDLYVARGGVRIEAEGRRLDADWVAWSGATGRGVAAGRVMVRESGDLLFAEALLFEALGKRGVLRRGRLDAQRGGFRIVGESIRKLSERRYALRHARFTTCRCPEADAEKSLPWELNAGRANLRFGGYAVTRNTALRVRGVPVLWLPWLAYPLKSERQSGLLPPDFRQSRRNGFEAGLPVFLALHDRVNLTVTPRWMGRRGLKLENRVSYVFGRESLGEIYASFLPGDDLVQPGGATPFDADRWAFSWLADHHLGGGFRHKVQARLASDNDYPFDFRDFAAQRSERYLESQSFIEGRFGALGRESVHTGVRFADDMQNPDDRDRDSFLLQRAPELQLAMRPRELFGAGHFSMDLRYAHFGRRRDPRAALPGAQAVRGLFLDTGRGGPAGGGLSHGMGDGSFQEGEPLLGRGHRLIANPRLHLPFRLGAVEALSELGYHGTFYRAAQRAAEAADARREESRNLLTGALDLRLRLRRHAGATGAGWSHVMEPRLAWSGLLRVDQQRLPLFTPRPRVLQERLRQFAPGAVLRDVADRIHSVNAVTLALGNRFYQARNAEGAAQHLRGDISLSAHWDFANPELRDVFLDGSLFPGAGLRLRFNLGWDFEAAALDSGLFELGWRSARGDEVQLNYRRLSRTPLFFESFPAGARYAEFDPNLQKLRQAGINGRWAATRRFSLRYSLRYSLEGWLRLENRFAVEYASRCGCWGLGLEVAEDRVRGVEVRLLYSIPGLSGGGAGRSGAAPLR